MRVVPFRKSAPAAEPRENSAASWRPRPLGQDGGHQPTQLLCEGTLGQPSVSPPTTAVARPSATAAAGAITPTPSPLGCQCPRRKCGPCTNIHELNAHGISTLCCEILADGSCNCPCPSCNPEEDEVSQPSPTPSIAAGTASRPPSPQPAQPLVADPSKQSAWRRWLARVWQTLQHALHGNTSTVIANKK